MRKALKEGEEKEEGDEEDSLGVVLWVTLCKKIASHHV